jgi:hypothetical protein
MELLMGKNLPHEQLSVQLLAKNVTQITLYQRSGKSSGLVNDT